MFSQEPLMQRMHNTQNAYVTNTCSEYETILNIDK